MNLLLVEDTESLALGLSSVLRLKGYTVQHVATGEDALPLAPQSDLVLLDAGLPGISGFDLLRQLREQGCTVPVLMLTARGEEVDRVLGFELGVDDYVVKPFSVAELLGRIGALLRRAAPATRVLQFGSVQVDLERFTAGGEALPARACDILRVLASRRGQAVTKDQLMDEVWGTGETITLKTVHNLIVRIRQLIEKNPENPQFLKTVHGVGYRLDF